MPWLGCLDAILWTKNHMKITAAHNVHHKVNRQQWGGTFAATFGKLATRVSEMGKDETGLGRWSWMLCKGLNGHTVCIIMAYNPNQSTRTKTKTIYRQHQSYFESHSDFTCPRKAFLCDFELKLQQWRSTGEKLIVFIDMNKDSLKGNIDAMLGLDGLEMTEVVRSTHPKLPVPPPSNAVTIADAMQLMDAMPPLTSEYSRQSGWQSSNALVTAASQSSISNTRTCWVSTS